MNTINSTNSSVSFNGLIINGTISRKNVKKLGDFASRVENVNFIKDLEKSYGVDTVLDKDISKMSFSHPKYGNLTEKYNCGEFSLNNVFLEVSSIIKNIKTALSNAQKDAKKVVAEKELIKRGC